MRPLRLVRHLFSTLPLVLLVACGSDNGKSGSGGADGGHPDVDPNHLPDGAPNPCLGAMDCSECTARVPCGWCGDRCLAGTATTSFDGTCTGTSWDWRGSQCPGTGATCPSHTDCVSCATDENSCGWCAGANRCVAGDMTGPARGVSGCAVASGTWMWSPDQCR